MINYDYCNEFTNVNDSYQDCVAKIMKLKHSKKFYIGATNDPRDRLLDHINKKKMEMMYVLCKNIPGKDKPIKLEKQLIERFKIQKNLNQTGGGEGIVDDYNFVYILFYTETKSYNSLKNTKNIMMS